MDGVAVDGVVGVLWKNRCIVMGGGECPYVAQPFKIAVVGSSVE